MTSLRLDGLEPDNLLAFLALLGLLRALEAARTSGAATEPAPRVAWDVEHPPLRPVLYGADGITGPAVAEAADAGLTALAGDHTFDGRANLDYSRREARGILDAAASGATAEARGRADVVAALMSDAAVKDAADGAEAPVDPTPFCLLFGQGYQCFLDRFAAVMRASASRAPRSRGTREPGASPAALLEQTLFAPWRRTDPLTSSFRWDPEEDVRYALLAGNPSDPAYKGGTQLGANRLAAAGLAALPVVPQRRGGRVRPAVAGGAWDREGFSFAWPVWLEPASLPSIRALLWHPALAARDAAGLAHLGVTHIVAVRRISVGKYMNFGRGRVISA